MNRIKVHKYIDDIKSYIALIGIFFYNGNLNRTLIYHNAILKNIKKLKYEFKNTNKSSLYEIRNSIKFLEDSKYTIKSYEESYFHPGYNVGDFDDFYESALSQLELYKKQFTYELLREWMY